MERTDREIENNKNLTGYQYYHPDMAIHMSSGQPAGPGGSKPPSMGEVAPKELWDSHGRSESDRKYDDRDRCYDMYHFRII